MIVDGPEHRPLYLLLPLRNRVAWSAVLALVVILVAVALPRIERAERDLKIVATEALATNIREAALFVNITWRTSAHPIDVIDAQRPVHIVNGYPAAADIDDAIWDHRGFVFYPELGLFVQGDADDPANCSVRYQPPARPDGGPTLTILADGC
jgi:hypothetical protein